MLLHIDSLLSELDFLSERELRAFQAAGLGTVGELLFRLPRRYEDRRRSVSIASLGDGDAACLQVHVYSAGWRFSFKRYFELQVGAAGEPCGARLYLRWFNMPYVAKMLATGMNLSIYGRVKLYGGKLCMVNPDFELLEDEDAGLRLAELALGGQALPPCAAAPAAAQDCIHTGRIVPVYRNIASLPARRYRSIVWRVLQELDPALRPALYDVAPRYPYAEALRQLHFPAEMEEQRKARMRFALGECFAQQFRVAWRRRRSRSNLGQVTALGDAYVQEMLGALPFRLTGAQQRCIAEIRADMEQPRQMNRLLQGDVGSGKTLVALCAMLLAYESGKTAALMAPTQILAEQHYLKFCDLLRHTDVPLSLRSADRREDSSALLLEGGQEDSRPRLIIGTHALLYKKNRPSKLGLVVIDEQHKFGVAQRERLIHCGETPDVLVMTATPIPRTLTLTLYGDLDVSVMDELPAQRGEIVTALRSPKALPKIIRFMREELEAGRQVYIVSPLVEESEKSERSSAVGELAKWKEIFPDYGIGLLHGRLSAEEKEEVMRSFRANELQLLVATTVVEVGVDVPNATIMLLNNADSFGLTQLHQLRGRIGRGQHKSYCILLSEAKAGDPGREKLEILCRTLNGFEIAEEDFRLRGPGDVLGTAQSGLDAIRFGDWVSDVRLIHRAKREADAVLDADPDLRQPAHAALRRLVAGEADEAAVVA